jgi:hypothetical protein
VFTQKQHAGPQVRDTAPIFRVTILCHTPLPFLVIISELKRVKLLCLPLSLSLSLSLSLQRYLSLSSLSLSSSLDVQLYLFALPIAYPASRVRNFRACETLTPICEIQEIKRCFLSLISERFLSLPLYTFFRAYLSFLVKFKGLEFVVGWSCFGLFWDLFLYFQLR